MSSGGEADSKITHLRLMINQARLGNNSARGVDPPAFNVASPTERGGGNGRTLNPLEVGRWPNAPN